MSNNRLNPAIFTCKPQYFPPFTAKRGLFDKFIQKELFIWHLTQLIT